MQFGSSIGEPLVTDQRLKRVANYIRKQVPNIPEGTEFVTFQQPATYAADDSGLLRPVPDVAVFGLQAPNPRHPQAPRLFTRSTTLEAWRKWDREHRHSSEIASDPLYLCYMLPKDGHTLPGLCVEWYESLRSMLN
jgi:hypothetical protein